MQVGLIVPILLVSLAMGGIGTSVRADEALPWEHRTPFREGAIYYEMSGTQQGTEILYIKDFGRLRVKQSQSALNVLGRTINARTREVTTPEWVIRYNLSERWGEKNSNPARLYQQEYEQLSPGEQKVFAANAAQIGPSLLENAGSIVRSRSGNMLALFAIRFLLVVFPRPVCCTTLIFRLKWKPGLWGLSISLRLCALIWQALCRKNSLFRLPISTRQ